MKKPFLSALGASLYIVIIVGVINAVTSALHGGGESILIPMVMLSLFVLSAAVMGFLFLYEPLLLLTENKKSEALAFFAKTVGIFACFVVLFALSLFLI